LGFDGDRLFSWSADGDTPTRYYASFKMSARQRGLLRAAPVNMLVPSATTPADEDLLQVTQGRAASVAPVDYHDEVITFGSYRCG
jgi:hypothetical protein